jgi:hypothetical protein
MVQSQGGGCADVVESDSEMCGGSGVGQWGQAGGCESRAFCCRIGDTWAICAFLWAVEQRRMAAWSPVRLPLWAACRPVASRRLVNGLELHMLEMFRQVSR